MSTLLDSIETEVDKLCNQQVDQILKSLFQKYSINNTTDIHFKRERYVNLKMLTHRLKQRMMWGEVYESTLNRYAWLEQKTKEARKNYHDAKRYGN